MLKPVYRSCIPIKDVAFATVDQQGLPQVRMIDVMLVEGEALYFCTARGKAFYHQLLAKPQVAITGMTQDWQMVRLNGKAYRLADQTGWIDRIFAANPSMEQVYPGDSRYILEAFCIDSGQVEWFDLGVSPIYRASFSLGSAALQDTGFEITEACIACGSCQAACPQQCIQEGAPYAIQQQHCLHCGACTEVCPVQAIQQKGA